MVIFLTSKKDDHYISQHQHAGFDKNKTHSYNLDAHVRVGVISEIATLPGGPKDGLLDIP